MDIVDKKFIEKFEEIYQKYSQLDELLQSVEIMSDNKLFVFYQKQKKQIERLADLYKNFLKLDEEIKFNNELFEMEQNPSIKQNLEQDNNNLKAQKNEVFNQLKIEYSKSNSKQYQKVKIEVTSKNQENDALVLFVDFLKNVFAEQLKTFELSNKNAVICAEGEYVYDMVSYFSGVVKFVINSKEYLLQVVVLNDLCEEFEFDESDVEIELSKSSGAGGQHINKTESAVRLIHKPTGITAECQDERSQTKNKERAFEILRNKILQKNRENIEKNIKNQRNIQKNAIFSSTPKFDFDFDANKLFDTETKKSYSLKQILSGDIKLLESDKKL